ncbi:MULTISPECIES: hypothetical protein [Streptomyces]|uniref:hypothetical protein n=1 Tax=Streptomyces lycopersici TaxID=2974589 RepID=UPI0021D24E91|nr:hypothetical protein [Streptomyces sp. NEAU-383]
MRRTIVDPAAEFLAAHLATLAVLVGAPVIGYLTVYLWCSFSWRFSDEADLDAKARRAAQAHHPSRRRPRPSLTIPRQRTGEPNDPKDKA